MTSANWMSTKRLDVARERSQMTAILKRGEKVLGKPREAMLVSLLPKGDGRLAQG